MKPHIQDLLAEEDVKDQFLFQQDTPLHNDYIGTKRVDLYLIDFIIIADTRSFKTQQSRPI